MAIDDLEIFDAARDAFEEMRAERDEARAEVARLKELAHQHAEKAAMFQQAAEDWRYIAKQYQAALKKEA